MQTREDNNRKAKLLQALKTAKSADVHSLEQSKSEAAALDENYKRLQRAMTAKDSLLKDLKARVETLEAELAAEQHRPVAPKVVTAPPGNALNIALGIDAATTTASDASLSVHELRSRYVHFLAMFHSLHTI